MKKILYIIWGIWCAIMCFISPVWLTMVFLNLTGLIYQYDYSMDEGTAFITGIIFLTFWLVFALLPNVAFIQKMYTVKRKSMGAVIVIGLLLCVLCIAMCGWDVIEFLTVSER